MSTIGEDILITGGASFVGSEFTRQVVRAGFRPIIIDKLTYAGDLTRLKSIQGHFRFYKKDICDINNIFPIFKKYRPKMVVHFAAESHVDRSIQNPTAFLKTNLLGTQVLLDACLRYGIGRFIHISTDEVYGDIEKGKFREDFPLNPNSPYSASKAAADLLVRSYIRTFNLPAVIVRPCNNYGPWQYPEKFIPVIIFKALREQLIPVYARGLNVREWLYVEDCAEAIFRIAKNGRTGETYNVGSGTEIKNVDLVRKILEILGKPKTLISFVKNRPGHDLRYSLDSSKIKKELGWNPRKEFNRGLKETVGWYERNFSWLENKAISLRSYWKKVYKPQNKV